MACTRHSLKVGAETIYAGALVLAEKHVVNPPREWLESLRWDGKKRVPTWLSTYMGVANDAYTQFVGRAFLVGAVARVYQPGCQFDCMPGLEVPQGKKKSTSQRTLFGEQWFSDTPLDLNSKDRFVGLRSNWCHEFAELDALGRAEIARVKSFLSSQTDDFRPPYGKSNVKVPRRCVFVGTTNEYDYLKDASGNRRFWPVRCGAIDIPALARDRQLLWAEALAMFQDHEIWWPEGSEVRLCEKAQEERLQRDAWQGELERYLAKPTTPGFVTMADLLGDALDLRREKWDSNVQARVGRCMHAIGSIDGRRRVDQDDEAEGTTDNRTYGYSRPEAKR